MVMLNLAIPDVGISAVCLFTIYLLIYSPDGTNDCDSRTTEFQFQGLGYGCRVEGCKTVFRRALPISYLFRHFCCTMMYRLATIHFDV